MKIQKLIEMVYSQEKDFFRKKETYDIIKSCLAISLKKKKKKFRKTTRSMKLTHLPL